MMCTDIDVKAPILTKLATAITFDEPRKYKVIAVDRVTLDTGQSGTNHAVCEQTSLNAQRDRQAQRLQKRFHWHWVVP